MSCFPPGLALHYGQQGYPQSLPHSFVPHPQPGYHLQQPPHQYPPHQYPPQGFQSPARPTPNSTFFAPATFSTGYFAPSPSTSTVPSVSLPTSFAHPTFPSVVPVPSLASPSPSSSALVGVRQDVGGCPHLRSELVVQPSSPSPSADEDAEGETVDEEEAAPEQSRRHQEPKGVEEAWLALMEQSTARAAHSGLNSQPLSPEQPRQREMKRMGRSYSSNSEDFDEVEEDNEDSDDDQHDEYVPPSVKRKGPSISAAKPKSYPGQPLATKVSTSKGRPSLSRDRRPSIDVGLSGTWGSRTEFFSSFEASTELLDEEGVRFVFSVVFGLDMVHPFGLCSVTFTPDLTIPSSFTYDESMSCWLTYRRNFITLSASLALPASLEPAALHTSTNASPVSHIEVGITSMTFPKGTNVELLQFDATRSLPKAKTLGRQQLVSVSSNQSGASPSRRTLQRSSSSSGDSETTYTTTFTRVQYRHSTSNHPSGSNTAEDARFVVRATLYAAHADGSETILGTWRSAKLVVRGRSPGSFEKTKQKRAGAAIDVAGGTTKRRKVASQAGRANDGGEEEDHPAQASSVASGSVNGVEGFDAEPLGIGGRTRRKTLRKDIGEPLKY
ncbi:hypothetical protein JCM1841_003167 [Sporobolomyces salmonicolor]